MDKVVTSIMVIYYMFRFPSKELSIRDTISIIARKVRKSLPSKTAVRRLCSKGRCTCKCCGSYLETTTHRCEYCCDCCCCCSSHFRDCLNDSCRSSHFRKCLNCSSSQSSHLREWLHCHCQTSHLVEGWIDDRL